MSYFRSNIERLAGYAPGEQLADGGVVKLNTNENPYPASPRVAEAIEKVLHAEPGSLTGLERYPNAMGQSFREQVVEALGLSRYGITPDWILCGNGSDDLLTICMRAFVDEGGLIRLPTPSYILYKTLAELQNANSEQVAFNQDWSLGNDFTAVQYDKPPQLVFLPNPNSPSGTLLTRERILELAAALPCPLLVDEAYADFASWNCIDLPAENKKILVTRTLSKSYALAGLRFGFLVAHPEMIEQLQKVKDSYNCDTLSIVGATAAIADQDWLTENKRRVLATRERLIQGMQDLGFEVVPSEANFTWNTHPTLELAPIYEGLRQQNMLVRFMRYEGWGEGLRISVGRDDEIDRLLVAIEELIKKG